MNRYYLPRLIATAALTILALLLMAAASSLILSGCRAARPAPTELPAPQYPLLAAAPDTLAAVRPALARPAPARPAFFLSTAAGSARRQLRRDARAAVPRKVRVKDGAFSWSGDAVAIGKKAGPAIVKSDSATQQVATNAVAGRGNTATQTAAPPRAAIAWYWWLLAVAAAVAWFVRKSIPFLG